MDDKIINVGIAGFGMSGRMFQAPFLHADKRFQIKKVYERSSEKSKEEYPYVEVVKTFEELLSSDIDLVVISTPNPLHVPMARQALEAGKNVVVEKPVAATAKEALELCKLAKEKDVMFSVYQNRRFDGDFLTVKKLIETGRLGDVLDYEVHFDRFVKGTSSKKWKAEGGKGISVLYDIGVHIIDQAYTLFGMPQEVYADFRKLREESTGIDNFEVILYYEDKKAILSAGEVVAKPGPHFAINGRKGSFLKYNMDVQERFLSTGKKPPQTDWGVDLEENYGTLYYEQDGNILEEKVPTETGNYGYYYDNIYLALTEHADLYVAPQQAADVLKIIEAAELSNEEKRRILI